MNKTLVALTLGLLLGGCQSAPAGIASHPGERAFHYMAELSSPSEGIGARPTTTEAESRTAEWLSNRLTSWGYPVRQLPFDYTDKAGAAQHSRNIEITLPGKSSQIIVVGAHYDSKGAEKGSLGTTDNASGVAALLASAEALRGETLPYTVRMVFFGAEENGVNGSKAYVAALSADELANILAMVNYDTIAGGDILYVHSAHSDVKEYKCSDPARYRFDPKVRDRLLSLSQQGGMTPYQQHVGFPGYPAGETGGWSDHAPFACAGIAVASVEATNFTINGEEGYDGYSQTNNTALWDCYDSATQSACHRKGESQWGKIWHTRFDRLDRLLPLFPGRLEQQLADGTQLMMRYLRDPAL
ncbi:Peptidase family M28 [Aeromonas sp. RU39B]|uniref:M28 family metallopeptidase n=1 Tax=Aeromonas sp. RU39B TaxID=1907416 RepID=UPI00095631E3|nr:M20/M25/M40 family metallo-hydrolase [Aeromonas sp. RU39B]SIR51588.1 Peptidase family M28 [Aeromonas sp. RU39B]